MIIRRKPPPPPGRGKGRRVLGEDQVLAAWGSRIEGWAGRVRKPSRLGMAREDVVQDLALAVLKEIRRHQISHREMAPDPLIMTVLKRRVQILNRDSRVSFRVIEDRVRSRWERHIDVADRMPEPERDLSRAELEQVCQALVYAIRENVPPAAFAILHLRHIEELTPTEIAALVGVKGGDLTNSKISKRIGYAKGVASAFLRSLGIDTWEDAVHAAPEDCDAD